jgi:hypothetical protein
MSEVLAENLRMRLAFLDATWEELAKNAGEKPGNVRAWVRRCTPRGDTLERLANLLGVPSHALLDPEFNPRDYPADGGNDEEVGDELDGQYG